MSDRVHYVLPVTREEATGLVADVYDQLAHELGNVPEPFTLHSPVPRLLAGVWMAFRESLLAGRVDRGAKEAVAAAVSDINRCPWCVDAHSAMLYATGNGQAVALITNGRASDADTSMRRVVEWARTSRSPRSEIVRRPPFAREDGPEFIGTAVTFHYLNRMVTAVLDETFLPGNDVIKQTLLRIGGWMYRGTVRQSHVPGASLDLLSDATLPDDLEWAASNRTVAGAFARLAATVEDLAVETLSPEARTRVREYVEQWNGADPDLSRAWVTEVVGELDSAAQPGARLALLCALAPHQIDAAAVRDFRRVQPADEALIAVLTWGSFTAARRIGSWLHVPS